MTEIRCKKCNRLLMKAKFVYAEIQCPKCGYKQEASGVDLTEHYKKKVTSVHYNVMLPLPNERDITKGGMAEVIISLI